MRSSRGVVMLLASGLTAVLAGCANETIDWFEPDWSKELDRVERKAKPIEDVPEPELAAPPAMPEIGADGPLELSVEQAVFLALGRNRGLSAAQLTPVITGAFEQIERGRFDPEVFANAEFTREDAIETARSTGEQFSVRAENRIFDGGVRSELPTGTTVELGFSQEDNTSNRAPEEQASRLGLTVSQALLRGFGPAVNLVAVRQAEYETLASMYELRGFVEALLAETEIAYWQYVLAEQEIAIFERSLEVARQQSEQVRQRIEVGVLPQTEAAALETEIAVREQALIDARSNLQRARLQLLRLMDALPAYDSSREVVITSDPLIQPTPIEDAEDRVALSQVLRPDVNEARLRLEQSRLETIRTRNGLLPRLEVFIAFGKTGYADSFSESLNNLDGSTYDFAVGAGFSQSVGQLAARGEFEASLASRQQAAAAVRNLEQLAELDVLLAINEAERARQQIAATQTTRQSQERTVQAELERFNVGASTSLLVAQAQRDLLQAQINEVEAVIGYRIALIGLYLAEGSLLERRGIRIGGGGAELTDWR